MLLLDLDTKWIKNKAWQWCPDSLIHQQFTDNSQNSKVAQEDQQWKWQPAIVIQEMTQPSFLLNLLFAKLQD